VFTQDVVISSPVFSTRHSITILLVNVTRHAVFDLPVHATGHFICVIRSAFKAQLLGPSIGPPIHQEPFVVFLLFALGIMANSGHWQVLNLGAKVLEEMIEQGYSVEDAHRGAQTTVTAVFGGGTEPSATGATGSNEPAPGATGPKLPPPSQMAANLAAKASGASSGSMPPPLPQAPPANWIWNTQPPPGQVTWQLHTTSPWDDQQYSGPSWDSNWWNGTWNR
jgi:hypothetical protein